MHFDSQHKISNARDQSKRLWRMNEPSIRPGEPALKSCRTGFGMRAGIFVSVFIALLVIRPSRLLGNLIGWSPTSVKTRVFQNVADRVGIDLLQSGMRTLRRTQQSRHGNRQRLGVPIRHVLSELPWSHVLFRRDAIDGQFEMIWLQTTLAASCQCIE